MATIFVRHDVSDFSTWKIAYDAFDGERKTLGVTGDGVYQTEGRPNNVTVYHHFESKDAARAFLAGDRLKDAMEKAGVVGTPDIWLVNRA